MITLDEIENIENESFFKKAKNLKNKILNNKYLKKTYLLTHLPFLLFFNLINFSIITENYLFMSIVGIFIFTIICNTISVSAVWFCHFFFNLLTKKYKISRFSHIDLTLIYNYKKTKEIINLIEKEDDSTNIKIKKIINLDLNNINKLIEILLLEKINDNSINENIKNKDQMINIAKKYLKNEEQINIFKKIEKIVIENEDNKKENLIEYKNILKKNIIIKNI